MHQHQYRYDLLSNTRGQIPSRYWQTDYKETVVWKISVCVQIPSDLCEHSWGRHSDLFSVTHVMQEYHFRQRSVPWPRCALPSSFLPSIISQQLPSTHRTVEHCHCTPVYGTGHSTVYPPFHRPCTTKKNEDIGGRKVNVYLGGNETKLRWEVTPP